MKRVDLREWESEMAQWYLAKIWGATPIVTKEKVSEVLHMLYKLTKHFYDLEWKRYTERTWHIRGGYNVK